MTGSRTRQPSPWVFPDFGVTPPFIPPLPPGGLLDPLPPREVPVRGGLLDPVGRPDFRDAGQRGTEPRIRRQDLPFDPSFEDWLRGMNPLGDSFSYGPRRQDDWSRSLDTLTRIESRPDGSTWEIRGPVSTMTRPPDDALAHYRTQPHTLPSTEKPSEEELRAIQNRFQSLVAEGRGHGYYFAADNLNHFLEGSGAPRFYDSDRLRSIPTMHVAESRLRQHFEGWMTGRLQPEAREERIEEDLLSLKEGQSFSRSSRWDGKFNTNPVYDYAGEPDLFLAVGESNIGGRGDFTFLGEKDGSIRFEGMVTHSWEDPYDWDKSYKWGKEGFTPLPTIDDPTRVISHVDAVRLQDHGGAKPFLMSSQWRRRVEGRLRNIGGRVILEWARWTDID